MGFGYKVYFTERQRNRVISWDPDLGQARVVAGNGATGTGLDQQLSSPYGLGMDASGHLMIADKMNHRLVRVTNQLSVVGQSSLTQLCSQQQPLMHPRRGDFPRTPTSVCASADGTYLVAYSDDYCIVRLNEQGDSRIVLGAPAGSGLAIPGYAPHIPEANIRQSLLFHPTAAVEGSGGTIYFIERGYQAVRIYRPGHGISGVVTAEAPRQGPSLPDTVPLAQFRCRYPTGLALLRTGELILSDASLRAVVQIDLNRQTVQCIYSSLQSPTAGAPAAVTVGSDGTLWVLDPGDGLVVGLNRASGTWKRIASRCSTLVAGDARCTTWEGAGIQCG
jgi:sugar lactone lactonase YvrE